MQYTWWEELVELAGLVIAVYVRVDRISLGGRAAAAGVFGRCRKRDCVRRREEDGKEKKPTVVWA